MTAVAVTGAAADAPAGGVVPSIAGEPSATADSLALAAAALASSADTAATAVAVPYGLGERLVFSIDYGPVNAGEGTLAVLDTIRTADGHACYLIESRAASNRFFSAFYKVRDRVISHIDRRALFSRYFEKRLREGNYRQNLRIEFNPTEGKAYYHDGRVIETERGVHDILSAFYYARTLELEVGHTYEVMTHNSRKDYQLQVVVHRREKVSVPAGEFECYVIEPKIIGDGLFQHEGQLTIWLSTDEHRIPVLMKTKVKVGSIDASLKEYTLGRPVVWNN
jgi:hypothetical protein